MHNEHNVPGPEYRVRPVVRYIVTRYCYPYEHIGSGENPPIPVAGGSKVVGEFQVEYDAEQVAEALRKQEVSAVRA
jgi:hypothetical protein